MVGEWTVAPTCRLDSVGHTARNFEVLNLNDLETFILLVASRPRQLSFQNNTRHLKFVCFRSARVCPNEDAAILLDFLAASDAVQYDIM